MIRKRPGRAPSYVHEVFEMQLYEKPRRVRGRWEHPCYRKLGKKILEIRGLRRFRAWVIRYWDDHREDFDCGHGLAFRLQGSNMRLYHILKCSEGKRRMIWAVAVKGNRSGHSLVDFSRYGPL